MAGPIALGTIRTSGVLGLRLVVQAGTLLLVARMLGPTQFGAFAGVAALAVILGTLATFGTHLVLLGEVSKDPARRVQVLPYAIPTTLLTGGLLLVVYLVTCLLVLREAGIPASVLVAIGVAEMLLQPLFGLQATEHHALGRIARSQLLRVLPLALRLTAAAGVFLLAPTQPLAAYGYGYLAASIIALVAATPILPAKWPRPTRWRLPTQSELKETAGYAALNITAASPAELDKTLATKLLPLGAAGLYSAAARVIGATTLPVIAMMSSALPRLFREGGNQPRSTGRLIRWLFAAALGYSIPLAVVLWLIAPLFVGIFGPKYQGIQHVIHWLCLVVPGMALRMTAGSTLMALGKPWMRVGFEVAGVVVLVVTSVILTAYYGTIGMSLALGFSEWTMAAMGMTLVRHAHHVERRSIHA